MAHDIDTVLGWRGSTVLDRDGDKIGSLKELYLDQDDRPAWGAVDTGLFGLRQTFVPLTDARGVDGGVQVPFAKDHVKDAPSVDPDAQLSEDEERRLYRHYELPSPDDAAEPAVGETGQDDATQGRRRDEAPPDVARDDDVPADATRHSEAPAEEARGDAAVADAPADADTDDAMTRSEEELVVGTRRRVRGKARLKKYVVTEHVQRTIPVQREEVRVEYEPAEGEVADEGDGDSRNPAN
jgi:stress response protein YsnF